MRERRQQMMAAAALSSGALGATLVATGTHALAAASTAATVEPDLSSSTAQPSPTGAGQPVAPAFGNGKHLTETLTPTKISADGSSTSQVKAKVFVVLNNSTIPWSCNSISFSSSDPGDQVSAATPSSGPGPFTATITASKTAGKPTITATCIAPALPSGTTTLHATAKLTQVGPTITLGVNPSSITADGTSTTTATATVKTFAGHPEAGDTVVFSSSDPNEKFSAVTGHSDGTYTVTITSSTKAETATITATDTSVTPNVHASSPLTQKASVPVPSTGAAPEVELGVGAALLALGGGAMRAAVRLRRRTRP